MTPLWSASNGDTLAALQILSWLTSEPYCFRFGPDISHNRLWNAARVQVNGLQHAEKMLCVLRACAVRVVLSFGTHEPSKVKQNGNL